MIGQFEEIGGHYMMKPNLARDSMWRRRLTPNDKYVDFRDMYSMESFVGVTVNPHITSADKSGCEATVSNVASL